MKTAESVTPKHPDKMCDQISDAILDWYLHHDEYARVAVEVLGGHGKVYICGEVTANAPEIGQTALEGIVREITGKELEIEARLVQQSPEIANGVDTGGAGDQGIMAGYACNDNEEMIPQELYLARSLAKWLYSAFPFDGKTQVTLSEHGDIETVVASFQNVEKTKLEDYVKEWLEQTQGIVETDNITIHANPAGDWNQGGFDADTGLTGRKLMVDNYGPQIAVGGGCFSGKDATKVDRSAAYMARRIAVDILKANQCKVVKVKLAYAIGVAEPVMVDIIAIKENGDILDGGWDLSAYNLTPKGIIEHLNLRKPQFQKTAEWGHFGNGFTWDK